MEQGRVKWEDPKEDGELFLRGAFAGQGLIETEAANSNR